MDLAIFEEAHKRAKENVYILVFQGIEQVVEKAFSLEEPTSYLMTKCSSFPSLKT